MTLKQFAEKITDKQLVDFWHADKELDLVAEAAKEGIIFAYVCDEDTIIFQGAYNETYDNYADSPKYPFDLDFTLKKGILGDEELSILQHYNEDFKYNNFQIYFKWKGDDGERATYLIEIGNIKYEKFKVLKGEEIYCTGVVFFKKDLV